MAPRFIPPNLIHRQPYGTSQSQVVPHNLLFSEPATATSKYAGQVDAGSGWAVPESTTEWTSLLAGTGIGNPSDLWLCQEAAGNLADSIGPNVLTAYNIPSYQNAVSGWSRKAINCQSQNDAFYNENGTNCGDIDTNSNLILLICAYGGTPSATKSIVNIGDPNHDARHMGVSNTPVFAAYGTGQATGNGSDNPGTGVHVALIQIDRTNGAFVVQTDQETIQPVYTAPAGGAYTYLSLGPDSSGDGTTAIYILYAALWHGSAAEMNSAQRTKLISLIQSPPAGG